MSQDKKVHDGHRERFREEIRQKGFEALPDHKLLEFFLFSFIPRKDTNEIAHNLLDTFGSLKNVINANCAELKKIKGMTQNAALALSSLPEFIKRAASMTVVPRKISNFSEAAEYCKGLLAGKRKEVILIICLDTANRVLNHRALSSEEFTQVSTAPRVICEEAYRHSAHKVLIAHNHPSGNCAPSEEDKIFTANLTVALSFLGIIMLDHIIIGEGVYSFHNDGFIKEVIQKMSDKIEAKVADSYKELIW